MTQTKDLKFNVQIDLTGDYAQAWQLLEKNHTECQTKTELFRKILRATPEFKEVQDLNKKKRGKKK